MACWLQTCALDVAARYAHVRRSGLRRPSPQIVDSTFTRSSRNRRPQRSDRCQSSGITINGRKVSLDGSSAVLKATALTGARCARRWYRSKRRSGGVLLNPLRNLLRDASLSAGNANVGGGIKGRSQRVQELHAELLAGCLRGHDGCHGLASRERGKEGHMYEVSQPSS